VKKDNNFSDMAVKILEILRENLGIKTPFILQSEIGVETKGVKLLIDIALKLNAHEVILPYPSRTAVDWRQIEKEGIGVKFLKFAAPVYPQFRGDFIGCLSILDMLFSLGKDSVELLKKSYVLEWDK
jgi:hypothetical protein